MELRETLAALRPADRGSLRLVYIPTHRECRQVLSAVASEIGAASRRSTDRFQMLVIDDRPDESAESNRVWAADEASSRDYPVNWIGRQAWQEFVEALLAASTLSGNDTTVAREALIRTTGSYGAAVNKASLLACYLNAKTLHRRDSDEFPGRIEHPGPTALEVEAAVLSHDLPLGDSGMRMAPLCTGSDVRGEPTKDHRDLDSVSRTFGDRLEKITSRRHLHNARHVSTVTVSLPVAAGHTVVVERDVTGRADLGVSALRAIYTWIPEMPATGIIGSDRFQKGLLYQLELPVFWHPLAALHRYDHARAKQTDMAHMEAYVVSELRYAVLKYYWNYFNVSLQMAKTEILMDGNMFSSDMYADLLLNVLAVAPHGAEDVVRRFIVVYSDAARLAAGPLRQRLLARVEALMTASPTVVGYVYDAVMEFAALIRLWPALVKGAESMRSTS